MNKSSFIRSVEFDENIDGIRLTFHNGDTAEYKNTGRDMYEWMMKAPSWGRFFHEELKPMVSKYTKAGWK